MQPSASRSASFHPAEGRFDCVLVGGGLANALVALALLERDVGARVALVERASRIGGNHTWSFHEDDVPAEARSFVDPLVAYRWPGYEVAFPGFSRALASAYATVTSERLDAVVRARFAACPGARLLLGREVASVQAERVVLADGEPLEATLVVDARGPERFAAPEGTAWQKFVGLELALAAPSPVRVPRLMDATVPQLDGYRFVYTLPFADDRVLVEDTYYADDPSLDVAAIEARVLAYARSAGLEVAGVVRREAGVLALPMRGAAPPSAPDAPLVAGFAGGWFHPTTGYSFPMAVRLALHVAASGVAGARGPALAALAAAHERQAAFARLLNRLLFRAVAPEERWHVLARFYRLPEPTIRRFYAMTTTAGDRARIVCGRPPEGISLRAALAQGLAS